MRLPPPSLEPIASRGMLLLALATAYFAAGKFGLLFAFVHANATPVWPPTGIALAAVLLVGHRVWPAILLGAFLVNLTTAGSAAMSAGIATGNTLEALLGGYLVGRYANGARAFERARDIFRFAALAGVLSTTVSASIGVTTLVLGGSARWADSLGIWWTWWLGDVGGALVVAPALVLWARTRPVGTGGRGLEACLLLGSAVLVGLVAFGDLGTGRALTFLCLPPLAWAAFRFGQREVATIVVVLSGIAILGTLHGLGSFGRTGPNESLLLLGAFMATISTTMLPVSALVSERRRSAEALLDRERELRSQAEATSRAKDEFLAMLSHELRNPLAAITSALHVLEGPARDPEQAAQASAILGRQVKHLARVVDDLLDLARVTSGRIELQRRPTDLAQTVADCVGELRLAGKLDAHEVAVSVRPAWVDADPVRLQQVVTNLLTNAIKYTPAGGHLSLSTGVEGQEGVLRVEDDGVGMPPQTLPHVFELFFQADGALARSQGGLGIGLTVARRLVDLHGGVIEAASAGPGRGAAFRVRLPSVPPPQEAPAPDAAAAGAGRGRLLLIEDNADARESLCLALEMSGYTVTSAEDGPKGVDAALRSRPDVALVDIGLPGIDGYEVARRIRAGLAGADMLLVALTGYGQARDRDRAAEAGFDLHVVKPVEPDSLVALLSAPRDHTGP